MKFALSAGTLSRCGLAGFPVALIKVAATEPAPVRNGLATLLANCGYGPDATNIGGSWISAVALAQGPQGYMTRLPWSP